MLLQTSAGTNASNAPVAAPVVTVNGQEISTPQATYQAAKAQRRELTRQMDELEGQRSSISSQLQDPQVAGADRKGLEARIGDVDSRISGLQKSISDADAQVAKAAGIPGAAIDLPEPPRSGPPEEAFVLGGIFMIVVFLPLSLAYARRIWKRGGQVVAAFPKEIAERMNRVEQIVDRTSMVGIIWLGLTAGCARCGQRPVGLPGPADDRVQLAAVDTVQPKSDSMAQVVTKPEGRPIAGAHAGQVPGLGLSVAVGDGQAGLQELGQRLGQRQPGAHPAGEVVDRLGPDLRELPLASSGAFVLLLVVAVAGFSHIRRVRLIAGQLNGSTGG